MHGQLLTYFCSLIIMHCLSRVYKYYKLICGVNFDKIARTLIKIQLFKLRYEIVRYLPYDFSGHMDMDVFNERQHEN